MQGRCCQCSRETKGHPPTHHCKAVIAVARQATTQTGVTTERRHAEPVVIRIQKMCKTRLGVGAVGEESEQEEEDDALPLCNIQLVTPAARREAITIPLQVAGQPLTMELDTGACVSLVSKKTWKNVLKAPKLKHPQHA